MWPRQRERATWKGGRSQATQGLRDIMAVLVFIPRTVAGDRLRKSQQEECWLVLDRRPVPATEAEVTEGRCTDLVSCWWRELMKTLVDGFWLLCEVEGKRVCGGMKCEHHGERRGEKSTKGM